MDVTEQPAIDLDLVRESTLDDPGFERALLEAFLSDNTERLQHARQALEDRDQETLQRDAHTIKGAAGTLGAAALADAARALESAAAAGRLADAPALLDALQHQLARVEAAVREHLTR